jgi:hypothetical protein
VLVTAGRDGTPRLRKMFRAETTVEYCDRKRTDGG